jgi:hypothetical protein
MTLLGRFCSDILGVRLMRSVQIKHEEDAIAFANRVKQEIERPQVKQGFAFSFLPFFTFPAIFLFFFYLFFLFYR